MRAATWCSFLGLLQLLGCVPSDGRPKAKRDAGRVAEPAAVRTTRPRLGRDAAAAVRARRPARADAAAPESGKVLPDARREPPPGQPFEDLFERSELGPDWRATSAAWRITDGRLCAKGARNRPIWLKRPLTRNARIEFDAVSDSPDGDIKVEVWGDGKSFSTGVSYTNASSYVVIFGGWKNQYHVLARLDEHGRDRREIKVEPGGALLRALPVQPEQSYHFKIERADGKTVRWLVDDIEILSFADRQPLAGPGHEHLGFNDWDVPVCFDNLMITPLAD